VEINCKYFTHLGFVIERTEENGGNLTFKDYASLELAFAQKVSNCLLGYLQLPYHVVTGKKKAVLLNQIGISFSD